MPSVAKALTHVSKQLPMMEYGKWKELRTRRFGDWNPAGQSNGKKVTIGKQRVARAFSPAQGRSLLKASKYRATWNPRLAPARFYFC